MTLSLTVQDPNGTAASATKVDLPAHVFDVELNVPLVHQVVVAQLASARQGTASTKTRGDVRGGGSKPYRQKGTGRARQGSTRAPQFAGGGTVHGPKPRSYGQRTPKKMKAAALRAALSDRARHSRVHVVSSLVVGEVPSTRTAAETLAKVSSARNVLVVAERTDELTWKSLRNVGSVHLLEPSQLNTYDVLISDDVVFTRDALEGFLDGDVTFTEAPAEKAPAKKTSMTKPAAKKAPAKKAAPEADDAEDAGEAGADDTAAPSAESAPVKKAAKKAPAAKKAAEPAEAEDSDSAESSDEENA
jgi:large subunit ribosomal protein L4